MKLLERLLLATDLTPGSEEATRLAIRVAKTFRSELVLLHVKPDLPEYLQSLDGLGEEIKSRMERLEQEVAGGGIRVDETVVVAGVPFDQIIHHANLCEVNVIITGSGEKQESRYRLGVTPERLIQRANKPVWVVKEKSNPEIRKILCPVDESGPSARALTNAIHLARMLQAELQVLTVIGPLTQIGSVPHQIEEAYLMERRSQFDDFLWQFDFHQVQWKKVVRYGLPHEQILNMAREMPSDLIVMGSVGRTGLARALMGSVAGKVSLELPCSIITVKGEDAIRLVLEKESSGIKGHVTQGRVLLEKGFPSEALNTFERCLGLDSRYVPAWEGLSEAHARLGQAQEARKCEARARQIVQRLWERRVEAEIRARHFQAEKKV